MRRLVLTAAAVACLLACGALPASAEFRDGTLFPDTAANGRLDLGPLYVFRSPSNANNTVFVLTVSPFTGVLTPATFLKGVRYDVPIDKTGDYVEDMTLRFTFGPPSPSDGTQTVLARCIPKARCKRYVIARGRTGQNIAAPGGVHMRAGNQDIPDFFDQGQWDKFAEGQLVPFPRTVANARDFYGPNGNCLAIVLEIPSARIAPTSAVIGAWSRVTGGSIKDREGRPFINTGTVPKLPRGLPSGPSDRRDEFNGARPQNDVAAFKADVSAAIQGFYGRTAADAGFLASAILPDALLFQIGNPSGFGTTVGPGNFPGPFPGSQSLGNGRRFSDDVHDVMLNLLTNGTKPSDNVGDDNGLRVTDGSVDPVSGMTRSVKFTYIGAPSNTPGAPNP
jgi:Domain of unknown function (DUF4331)